ncbi:hypothetical protein PCANB_000289 [Pneumocystis canis]|nr:hypothetical protein PCK1_000411 [Pneumocystis canis]KAG5437943.1 hypothetical protein PCANB_000289 [Pneumocystis canis]
MENINLNEENSQETTINVLKDAFPGIDEKIINAILIASQGSIGPAFEALLSITDSNYQLEPLKQNTINNTKISDNMRDYQIQNDYNYACHLSYMMEQQSNVMNTRPSQYNNKKEHSFINDELPIIRENLKHSFDDAKVKVSNFFSNIKKRINNDISYNEKMQDSSSPFDFEDNRSSKILFNRSKPTSFSLDDDSDHSSLKNNENPVRKISFNPSSKNNSDLHIRKNDNDVI